MSNALTLVVRVQMRGDSQVRTLRDVRMTSVYPHRTRPARGGRQANACLVVHYMSISKPSEYFPLTNIDSLTIM